MDIPMKPYSLFYLVLFFTISFSASNSKAISIEELLSIVDTKAPSNIVFGWERISSLNSAIRSVNATDIQKFMTEKSDLSKLGLIISKETDYDCIIGEKYFIILPKSNSSEYDTPLSLRRIRYADNRNVSIADFFTSLKSSDVKNSVFLTPPLDYRHNLLSGEISIQSGESIVYEVLNDITRQLNGRIWLISHSFFVLNEKIDVPMRLGVGTVDFYATIKEIPKISTKNIK